MNIFESLENLNVSEECFDEIMGIVEDILSEGNHLRHVVKRAEKAGKLSSDKAKELEEKAMRVKGTNDIYKVNRDDGSTVSKLSSNHKPGDLEVHKNQVGKKSVPDSVVGDEDQIYKAIDKNLRKKNPRTGSYDNMPSTSQFKQVNKYIRKDNPSPRIGWTPKNKKNYYDSVGFYKK